MKGKKMLLIKNCSILLDNNKLDTTDILIKNNRIVLIEKNIDKNDGVDILDATGKWAVPGLINSHTHSYSNIFKGAGEKLPLEIWMYYAYLSGILTDEEFYYSVILGSIELIKSGVTSCLDHIGVDYNLISKAVEVYKKVGLRSTISPMVTDIKYLDTLPLENIEMPTEILKRHKDTQNKTSEEVSLFVEKVIKDFHGNDDLIRIMPGPSGPQRCSDELLVNLYNLSEKYDLGIHTHLLETKIQAVTAYEQYGTSMVEHLESLGVLSDRWSMAHSVWLSDKEIDLLAHYDISVVHNPYSNLYLGSGIAPIIKYKDKKINMGLGTDGSNCGGTQNIFSAINLAPILSHITTPDYDKWIGYDDVYKMVTRNGSKILRIDDIGELKEGSLADIVLINMNSDYLTPNMNLIHQLVYCEKGESVDSVIINGKIVMKNRKLITIDEAKILKEAEEIFIKMKSRIEDKITNSSLEMDFVSDVFKKSIYEDIGYHRSGYWQN